MNKHVAIVASTVFGLILSAQAAFAATEAESGSGSASFSESDATNTDSFNETNIEIKLSMAVATGDLSGTVSGNSVEGSDGDDNHHSGHNYMNDGSFSGSSGITVAAQNAGANSLVQQNVVVQSNLSLGSE
jgi:hypothetical protein